MPQEKLKLLSVSKAEIFGSSGWAFLYLKTFPHLMSDVLFLHSFKHVLFLHSLEYDPTIRDVAHILSSVRLTYCGFLPSVHRKGHGAG